MTEPSFNTALLHEQIERLRAGDRAAQDELVRVVGERMTRLAHRMLQGYPSVRSAADTNDVLQNSYVRLLAALAEVRPDSTLHFFRLAACLIRQELIDLLRREQRRRTQPLSAAMAATEPAPDHLDAWLHFHEAVDQLPTDAREVVGLTYYHGWTQAQIAEVLAVDVRTVRRRWAAACLALRETLGDQVGDLFD